MKNYQKIYDLLKTYQPDIDQLEELILSLPTKESKRLQGLIETYKKDASPQNLNILLLFFERKLDLALKDEDFLSQQSTDSQKKVKTYPLELVLDNLRSAWNVGSIIRSAEAMGAKKIWLYGYTPGMESEKVKKSAKGAQENIEITSCNIDLLENKKEDGFKIFGVETKENAKELSQAKLTPKSLFIFGNERFGISKDLRNLVEQYLSISLVGKKQSLNVGTALAICLYEYTRQNGEF